MIDRGPYSGEIFAMHVETCGEDIDLALGTMQALHASKGDRFVRQAWNRIIDTITDAGHAVRHTK